MNISEIQDNKDFSNQLRIEKEEFYEFLDKLKNRLKLRPFYIKLFFFILFILRVFDPIYLKIWITKRKIRSINKKITRNKTEQKKNIKLFLENEHPDYKKLMNENYNLLKNTNLTFKTYTKEGSAFSSYSKKLEGSIKSNGFLYLKTTSRNIVKFSFESGYYPTSFRGEIDYLGNSTLITTSLGFIFFGGKIPKRIIGSVTNNGEIIARIDKSVWEFGGHFYMGKLICDPFNGDSKKREKFLENKYDLLQRIKDFESKY